MAIELGPAAEAPMPLLLLIANEAKGAVTTALSVAAPSKMTPSFAARAEVAATTTHKAMPIAEPASSAARLMREDLRRRCSLSHVAAIPASASCRPRAGYRFDQRADPRSGKDRFRHANDCCRPCHRPATNSPRLCPQCNNAFGAIFAGNDKVDDLQSSRLPGRDAAIEATPG
jgi:hypothetical protein